MDGRLNWCTITLWTLSRRFSTGPCDMWEMNCKCQTQSQATHLRRRRRLRRKRRRRKKIEKLSLNFIYVFHSTVRLLYLSAISFNRSFFCCRHSRVRFMVTLTADRRRWWRRRRLVFNSTLQLEAFPCVNSIFFIWFSCPTFPSAAVRILASHFYTMIWWRNLIFHLPLFIFLFFRRNVYFDSLYVVDVAIECNYIQRHQTTATSYIFTTTIMHVPKNRIKCYRRKNRMR